MRRICVFLLLSLALSSCSHDGSATDTALSKKWFSPADCSSLPVLSTVTQFVPNAAYIPTEWEPSQGTDLESALNAGGIACTYGIANAEIGGTIIWSPSTQSEWDARKKFWLAGDFQQSKIDGFNDALILKEGIAGVDGAPRWNAIGYYQGFWISANLSFVQSLTDGESILRAAQKSLRSQSDFDANSIVGCYVGKLARDNYLIDVTAQDNNKIIGTIAYLNFQKDSSHGEFQGTYTNGILNGLYIFESEGMTSIRELFYKGDRRGFVEGYGPAEMKGDISYFTRPLQIKWQDAFTFTPSQECRSLLKPYTK